MIRALDKLMIKALTALTKLGLFFFVALSMLVVSCIMTPVIAWYRQIDLSSAILRATGALAFNYLILGLFRLLRPDLFPKLPHSRSQG